MQGRDCALTYPQSFAHEGASLVSVVECSWEDPLSIEAKSPRPTAHTRHQNPRNIFLPTATADTSAISRSDLVLGPSASLVYLQGSARPCCVAARLQGAQLFRSVFARHALAAWKMLHERNIRRCGAARISGCSFD